MEGRAGLVCNSLDHCCGNAVELADLLSCASFAICSLQTDKYLSRKHYDCLMEFCFKTNEVAALFKLH